jgi:hypothetical protein
MHFHSGKSPKHARLLEIRPRCVRLLGRCRWHPRCIGAYFVSADPSQPDPNRNSGAPGLEKLPFPTGSALAICNPGTEGARRRLRPKPKYRARFEPSPDRHKAREPTGEQEGWAVHASIIVRRNYGKVDGGPGGAKRNCHDWSRQTQRCTSNQLVRTSGI